MRNYLLPLSILHAAAPGILNVIFGPDGDFARAPRWDGPVVRGGDSYFSYRWWTGRGGNPFDVALDLRVPAVFARVAGVCARALGFTDPAVWSIQDEGGGVYALYGVLRRPRYSFEAVVVLRWDNGRAMGHGTGGASTHPDIGGGPFESLEHFLASLILTLAPRIAALKESK